MKLGVNLESMRQPTASETIGFVKDEAAELRSIRGDFADKLNSTALVNAKLEILRKLDAPVRLEIAEGNGSCWLVDGGGKEVASTRMEATDDGSWKEAMAALISTHNQGVVKNLGQKLKALIELVPAEREKAGWAEYVRLGPALEWRNGDKPAYFSVEQTLSIAKMFRLVGRTDLSEEIQGINVGKNLHERAKSKPDCFFRLENYLEAGYFTAEDLGVDAICISEMKKKYYRLRVGQRVRTLKLTTGKPLINAMAQNNNERKFNLPPGIYGYLVWLLDDLLTAGMTLAESGLKPEEIEVIRKTVSQHDALRHAQHGKPDREDEVCKCPMFNTTYWKIVFGEMEIDEKPQQV